MRRFAFLLLLATPLFGGAIVPAGSLQFARSNHDAALLPDGRVLVGGGTLATSHFEIFDVRSGTSTLDAESPLPLEAPAMTALADRVVITGGGYLTDGRPGFGNYGDRYIGTYGVSGYAGQTGALIEPREWHTATALPDGRLLIAGGETQNIGGFHVWRSYSDSIEIFDPATSTSRLVAHMAQARARHTATLLRDGRVLLAGGIARTDEGELPLRSAEIFSPQSQTLTEIELPAAFADHTATLLDDGHVLLIGTSAVVFDPETNAFALAGAIGALEGHTATKLRDGRVFIAGGEDAIVWDPARNEVVERIATGTFSGHAAVLLDDGSVLLIGGMSGWGRTARVLRYLPDGAPRRRAVRK